MPSKQPFAPPDNKPGQLAVRADELRQALRRVKADILAKNTATTFIEQDGGSGTFQFELWDQPVSVSYPDFRIIDEVDETELNIAHQALILYYFYTADGTPSATKWISFSELQDGQFYTQAFQGYTGQKLANFFNDNLSKFELAAERLNGIAHNIGDASFIFPILPMVSLLAVAWLGDEDFPSNFQILFDTSVNQYLPTDACAIAGSMLTGKIINAV